MMPKVSVVMSVYNSAPYLKESIESILYQAFTDFEFIIIDDGSSDRSWEILTEYENRDQRVRVFKNEENIGLTKSLNKGLKLAQGEYIARQDADDVAFPERFEKQVALLDKHSEVVLTSCDIEVIDSEGHSVAKHQRACEPELVAWYLLFYNHLAGHSQVMFRRKSVEDLGGYCETYRYCQDYELWCRLVKVGDIVILPEVLQQQRLHSKSISFEKSSQQTTYALSQSSHNIGELIGKELSLEELADLTRFWTGHLWWNAFPASRRVGAVHSRIKEIYQAFLQQGDQQNFSDLEMSRQLRLLIGQQFLGWILSRRGRKSLLSKLLISLYAFRWHPSGVLECWLKEL
jgi:glycosyltransferase involved in cell wall biosynthesis